MREALEGDFPRTRKWLGDPSFYEFITDFLLQGPSHYASMSELTFDFPQYLASQQLKRVLPQVVCDLAQYECLCAIALAAQISEARKEFPRRGRCTISLASGVGLLQSRWPIQCIKKRGPSPKRHNTYLVIFSDPTGVRTRLLKPSSFRILQALARRPLSLTSVAKRLEKEKMAPSEVVSQFRIWYQHGIVSVLPP